MTERIFYANQQVAIKPNSDGSAALGAEDVVHGVQSVGMTTTFNLVQVFELGQLALYENAEDLPDVEVTLTKVLDGYPLMWNLATYDTTTGPTLINRSTAQCIFELSTYPDTQIAEGAAQSVVQCSGMYPSSLSYNFTVDDPFTEELTLVGNSKIWKNPPTYNASLNTQFTTVAGNISHAGQFLEASDDTPGGSGGPVARRQHLQLTHANAYDRVQLPLEIIGVDTTTSGIVLGDAGRARLSSISVSTDLGRENILELGRRAPFTKYVSFPTEVTCDVEVTSTSGDAVSATEEGIYTNGSNLANRIIRIATTEGTRIYLGSKNKLSSVSYGGGDTAGGNATVTYSYSNFNDMTVLHASGVGTAGTWWTNRADYLD